MARPLGLPPTGLGIEAAVSWIHRPASMVPLKLTFASCAINLSCVLSLLVILVFAAVVGAPLAAGQANKQPSKPQPITTNKDKLLTLAVQGQIVPAQVTRAYATTWDGKLKAAIGIGGINYNLKIGDKVFAWASGDRATVGVATEGIGEDRFNSAWLTYTSFGNETRFLSGKASGEPQPHRQLAHPDLFPARHLEVWPGRAALWRSRASEGYPDGLLERVLSGRSDRWSRQQRSE